MKLGILFSGQGAQKAGMGLDLYQNIPAYQATVDQASSILGYDLQEVANDDAKIKQTAYAQPAILTMSNAIINALGDALPTPVAGLGLSLGEYSALSASGAKILIKPLLLLKIVVCICKLLVMQILAKWLLSWEITKNLLPMF